MIPNLFNFATSELSQDAVLCWLLSWADNKYKENNPNLHDIAKLLLYSIYHKAKIKTPAEFSKIEIRKQDGGIDILCIINDHSAILIEDKVGTKQHSNQLARYKEHILNNLGFSIDNVILVYLQTGDQSNYKEIEQHGYQTLLRQDLLNVFESDTGRHARSKSDILRDFSDHIRRIENGVQSYASFPIDKWTWDSWKGFYIEIQRRLQDGDWDYIANPAGGFFGFWWHFKKANECEVYLQIEQDKLCFKIWTVDAEKRKYLRQHWHEIIINECQKHNVKAQKPSRFGYGQYMTVAILEQEYRITNDDGIINMGATLEMLKSAQSVIDNCLQDVKAP